MGFGGGGRAIKIMHVGTDTLVGVEGLPATAEEDLAELVPVDQPNFFCIWR